ncbi:hypothetical protein FH972_021240 [Carpinus fangiana]|uniref:Uncharacterized protein n=1 Tax=Carpinus fangiana TaxID=176857 RepID=A0A5N6KPC3_9ROSI|nr:hypothetical protein FH972_021240 [Carpinus fangiana]
MGGVERLVAQHQSPTSGRGEQRSTGRESGREGMTREWRRTRCREERKRAQAERRGEAEPCEHSCLSITSRRGVRAACSAAQATEARDAPPTKASKLRRLTALAPPRGGQDLVMTWGSGQLSCAASRVARCLPGDPSPGLPSTAAACMLSRAMPCRSHVNASSGCSTSRPPPPPAANTATPDLAVPVATVSNRPSSRCCATSLGAEGADA